MTRYYDPIIRRVMPAGFRDVLTKQINPGSNEYILDFGTGTGELAMLLKKMAPQSTITALDIDAKVLKIAKEKILIERLDIKVIEYNGTVFPLESGCFDKVVSCLVFHHLSPGQKREALLEIFRVLKKNGKLYIADWGLERNKIKARFLNIFALFKPLRHLVEHGKGLLPRYLLEAGFKNITESAYLKTRTGTLCYYEAQK